MNKSNNAFALSIIAALFFAMGFITVLNDVLIPHLKELFSLSYFQAALVQFCFFAAYFITSSFFAKLAHKINYQNGVAGGFLLTAVGCLMFYPAASMQTYSVFLAALFILASGLVLLQVVGNPFVTLLSAPGSEARNLTLVQAFGSLGTTVGPLFGSLLILSNTKDLSKAEQIQAVQYPYLYIAIALVLLALFVKFAIKLPDVRQNAEQISQNMQDKKTSAWQHKRLSLGALAIFCYVGAEVAIGSWLVNYLIIVAKLDTSHAADLLTYYWGGAMVGRFAGSYLMRLLAPHKCLAFNCVVAVCLIMLAMSGLSEWTNYALIGVGLFNSIMFATIFSLATKNLGRHTSQASGIICMSIVGGAIIPPIQGAVIDNFGIVVSFIIPAVCYLYILFFATKGCKIES